MVDIEYLSRKYFAKDKPVEYTLQNQTKLMIYPILVDDWDVFEDNSNILMYDKNSSNEIEIIQMSYLQFLTDVIFYQVENSMVQLDTILKLCLHIEKEIGMAVNEKGKPIIIVDCEIDGDVINGGIFISSMDFDNIKRIILYQNLFGYDDEYINPEIKQSIEDYQKLTNGDLEPIPLEDKITFVENKSGLLKEQILKLTYRDLSKRFDMLVEEIENVMLRTAELSGNVTFKQKIEPMFRKTKKSKYEDMFTDKSSFDNKVGSVT